jgi:hypothetical protein
MMHFVEEIVDVRPFRLTVRFSTGELRCVDLEVWLRGKVNSSESALGRLLDPVLFCQVRLDRDARTVCWDGLARQVQAGHTETPAPLDFCPDVLYALSVPVAEDHALAASIR